MTFTEIVTEVQSRLNLSSSDSTTRIGLFVNSRYKRLTSSLGINTSRRAAVTVNTVAGTATIDLALEKIELVYIVASGQRRVLDEITYAEWRERNVNDNPSGSPQSYAIKNAGAATVTLALDPTPDEIVAVYGDGLAPALTLSGSTVPAFPADFHDALVFGAVADELFKMEKDSRAKHFEGLYDTRVADLRYFLAKSSSLSLTQGGAGSPRRPRYRVV